MIMIRNNVLIVDKTQRKISCMEIMIHPIIGLLSENFSRLEERFVRHHYAVYIRSRSHSKDALRQLRRRYEEKRISFEFVRSISHNHDSLKFLNLNLISSNISGLYAFKLLIV